MGQDSKAPTQSPLRKLTPEQVLEMRKLRQQGVPYAELAVRFEVSAQAAHSACEGKTYRDVH